jgi:hypothetical protein
MVGRRSAALTGAMVFDLRSQAFDPAELPAYPSKVPGRCGENGRKMRVNAFTSAGCISGPTCYLTEIATDLLLFGAVVAKSRSIVESINYGA